MAITAAAAAAATLHNSMFSNAETFGQPGWRVLRVSRKPDARMYTICNTRRYCTRSHRATVPLGRAFARQHYNRLVGNVVAQGFPSSSFFA